MCLWSASRFQHRRSGPCQIAEDDKVVTRWTAPGTNRGELMGVPSANRSVAVTGISSDRFRAGKIVESWSQTNHLKIRPPR
jgi:predicted ester cyclase